MKKVAVLSDIHGNYVALDACMEYCRKKGVETYIFLGDYVGEFSYPERTMERIYEIADRYECHFVRGNREQYMLDYRMGKKGGWSDFDSTTGSLLYCYGRLTEWDFVFFENLPLAMKIEFDGLPSLTACHGSPENIGEKMMPGEARTVELMRGCDTDVILCGHTHIQNNFFKGRKALINPGSVGFPQTPLSCGPKAQFVLMSGENAGWRGECVTLDYDAERVLAELDAEKLERHAPYWTKVTKQMLGRSGAPDHGTVLKRAMELCEAAEGTCVWPNVPELYWARAFSELAGN